MDSKDLAQYIEQNHGLTKPWLLAQVRLKKLQEQRHLMSDEEYLAAISDLQQDMMNLGEWWVGIEDEVFK
jgi:hypothetical protein